MLYDTNDLEKTEVL